MKVIVVGGGVIGMLQAHSLAQEGFSVSLIDKNELGREASWAGGGIISPLYPWRYSEPVTALASRSQELYPDLVSQIHQESGIDPEYSGHGLLVLRVSDEQAALHWGQTHGPWLESIKTKAIYDLEPNLAAGHEQSLWMPDVGSIRNPRLLNALRSIMHTHPKIEVFESSPVQSFSENSVTLATGETHTADKIVFCSGAWTSDLMPEQAITIEPVKGQMVIFDAPRGLVNRVVLSDGRYVIPRQDGKVLAGSTLEYKGFDKLTDKEAKESLFLSATKLFPSLANHTIIHHWAGLRPGSPDGIPSIGLLKGYDSVYVNAGHFRNGLVLAPASVELLSSIIANRSPKMMIDAYSAS